MHYGLALGSVAPSGSWIRDELEGDNVKTQFRRALEQAVGEPDCGSSQPLRPTCPARPFAWWRIGSDEWSHIGSGTRPGQQRRRAVAS